MLNFCNTYFVQRINNTSTNISFFLVIRSFIMKFEHPGVVIYLFIEIGNIASQYSTTKMLRQFINVLKVVLFSQALLLTHLMLSKVKSMV